MEQRVCMRCGGCDLKAGRLRGPVWFESEELGVCWCTQDIPVLARICMECGEIEVQGDVTIARRPFAFGEQLAGGWQRQSSSGRLH